MLQTNGCEPSSGQRSLLLNSLVYTLSSQQNFNLIGEGVRLFAYIPHHFIHQLGQSNRVTGRAGANGFKGPGLGIGDVALVVGTVCVFSVPASGKGHGCPDAAFAKACRKCLGIRPRAGRSTPVGASSETTVAELLLHSLLLAQSGVSDKHSEAWLERSHCRLSVVWGDIVDRHSSALV